MVFLETATTSGKLLVYGLGVISHFTYKSHSGYEMADTYEIADTSTQNIVDTH